MRVGSDAVRESTADHERGEAGVVSTSRNRQVRSLLSSLGPAIAIVVTQLVIFPMPAGIFLRGVVVGALMALLALGMALVYRANRIINFAQSYMGFAPALLVFLLMDQSGLPYGVAVTIGLASALVLGAATERVVIRRFFRAPRLLVTIATIGLGQLLAGAALLLPSLWDTQVFSGRMPAPFTFEFEVGTVVFDANDLLGLIVAPLTVLAVALFLQRSEMGMAIRASADSADRAALLGIPVHRLQTLVWMLASALAFVTVFLRSGILGLPTAGTQASLSLLLLPLVALVLGRLTDLAGVTSAAVALGVLVQGVDWNYEYAVTDPVLGVVLVVALVARRREIGRRDVTEDTAWRAAEEVRPVPPALARRLDVRLGRWVVLGLVGVVAVVLPQTLDVGQTIKASALLIYAILGVSLVVLSGWGGIISLGHVAYFALGAAVAGWSITELDLDLLPAMLVAMVAGAAAATIVGIPAIRLRGLYLAVTSFAFALAALGYLLNDEYFGWVPHERIERVPLLGGFEVASEDQTYYLALAVLVVVVLGVRNIRASRFGRALVALRDNDRAAQAYSIDAVRVQLGAFAVSGAIAALAGALLLHHERTFDPSLFGPVENLAVFTMVVVGGMTSATGAILGALFLLGTRWFLPTEWQVLAAGAGVIVVLLLFPSGLASVVFAGRDRLLRLLAKARGLDVPGYSRTTGELDSTTGLDPLAGGTQPDDAVLAESGSGATSAAAEPPTGDELLSARGVEVGYGGVKVLFGVDLDVRAGEAVALLGTNGAGKSTLLKAISGLVEPQAGTIELAGDDITGEPAHKVAARGVMQMPGGHGVFPTLTVAENLRVASWLHRRDAAAVEAGIRRVHELFPVLAERAGQRASHLSGGQQQMLALGMAVLGRPKLLMIDELSLGLAPSVVGELLRFVNHLRDDGTTLLVVEQSVNVALEIADRAVFLERGQVRFSGPARDILDRPDLLRSVFLGSASPWVPDTATPATASARNGQATPADTTVSTTGATSAADTDAAASQQTEEAVGNGSAGSPAATEPAKLALQVIDLAVHFDGVRAVDRVSFDVAPGEIVGIIGPNGAGKTTLFDLLSGFVEPSAGKVLLLGDDVTRSRASARARRGLGRSFQDARLFSTLTVDQAIAAARERWVQAGDPLSAAFALPNVYDSEWAIARRVDELVEMLGLGPYRSLFVGELSTGTRRVVDLACLLAHRPRVVLLDEPAAGIAQREVEALAPLIRRIRDDLKASVVLVEHDMPLVESVADRLVAMDRGRVLAVGSPADVLADPAVVSSYLGNDAAVVQRSGDQSAITGR
jgi:ABC-type branched-subunit amino acid transport system ATPase component/ABC-type branched-subunit amino acid transport system permease subunit